LGAFQDELRVTSGRLTHAFHAKLTRAGSGIRSTNGESNAGALVPQIYRAPGGFNPGRLSPLKRHRDESSVQFACGTGGSNRLMDTFGQSRGALANPRRPVEQTALLGQRRPVGDRAALAPPPPSAGEARSRTTQRLLRRRINSQWPVLRQGCRKATLPSSPGVASRLAPRPRFVVASGHQRLVGGTRGLKYLCSRHNEEETLCLPSSSKSRRT
jgi:hypothetical protein